LAGRLLAVARPVELGGDVGAGFARFVLGARAVLPVRFVVPVEPSCSIEESVYDFAS
jgi:hypothetical protein